jgi:redox-sensitive bicupin YhaK (pirin superfamily)
MTIRTVKKIYPGTPSIDGAGVHLNRIFANQDVEALDPFLLLDFFDADDPQLYLKGFPWHPHRGIETITYLVEGLLEHGDSLGNSGMIEPLGCQWMTAGSGIIHQEMPQASDHMLGAQLWLNLPRADKMTEPTYREITAADLAVYEDDDVLVRVICGEFMGKKGPVKGTFVDPFYFDVTIHPGGTFAKDTPAEETVFLLLLSGSVTFPDNQRFEPVSARGLLLTEGEQLQFTSDDGARFLVMAGKPLHEPVAWGGPIVMNTREELRQAFDELDQGTFIKKK